MLNNVTHLVLPMWVYPFIVGGLTGYVITYILMIMWDNWFSNRRW